MKTKEFIQEKSKHNQIKLTVLGDYHWCSMSPWFHINDSSWILPGKVDQLLLDELSGKDNFIQETRRNFMSYLIPREEPLFLQNFRVILCSWQIYLPRPFWRGAFGKPDFKNKWLFDISLKFSRIPQKFKKFKIALLLV